MLETDLKENFGEIISRVMAANPDLVYFASRDDQAGPFFREARATGYMGTFLGIDGANTPSLVELAGPLLIEGGGMYYTDMVASASYYPNSSQFVQDFLFYYGSFPQLYAAEAYDAAGICLKAIEQASKAKGGEIPTRAEVATAIRAIKDYKGITGTYNFNERGDPTPARYFVFKAVSVAPRDWEMNPIVTTLEVEPPD
jgi:branched-chain amino acid transport system substrate-binding protein